MKPIIRFFIFGLWIAYAVPLKAQTVITGDAFPAIGDTFLVATDRLPYQIVVGEPGEARLWDFSSLQAPFARRTIILPFTNRTALAELDQAEALMEGFGNEESFVRIGDKQVLEVGRKVPHPLDASSAVHAAFTEPVVMYEKLAYGDRRTAVHKLVAPVHLDVYDDRLKKARKAISKLGEIRYVWEIRFTWHVDAWGNLRIPFGRYRVLRQQVTEEISFGYEVKDASGNWKPVDAEMPGLPVQPRYSRNYFVFWSDDLNHPPAIVFMDGTGMPSIDKILYKSFPLNTRIVNDLPSKADVLAYPNPTFNFVRFDFMNLPDGNYLVDIYNILGVRLQSFDVEVNGYTTSEFDLSDLKKGTYIYRIRNEQNRTITSKRLIIIQP